MVLQSHEYGEILACKPCVLLSDSQSRHRHRAVIRYSSYNRHPTSAALLQPPSDIGGAPTTAIGYRAAISGAPTTDIAPSATSATLPDIGLSVTLMANPVPKVGVSSLL